jgi:ArsR family transcriptional regulator
MGRRLALASLTTRAEHVQAFKALAHPGRLDVFFALVRAKGEMAVGDLKTDLGIPGPTLSHHLDQLRRAGIVQARRDQRFIYYSANKFMVTDLVRLLTVCC